MRPTSHDAHYIRMFRDWREAKTNLRFTALFVLNLSQALFMSGYIEPYADVPPRTRATAKRLSDG